MAKVKLRVERFLVLAFALFAIHPNFLLAEEERVYWKEVRLKVGHLPGLKDEDQFRIRVDKNGEPYLKDGQITLYYDNQTKNVYRGYLGGIAGQSGIENIQNLATAPMKTTIKGVDVVQEKVAPPLTPTPPVVRVPQDEDPIQKHPFKSPKLPESPAVGANLQNVRLNIRNRSNQDSNTEGKDKENAELILSFQVEKDFTSPSGEKLKAGDIYWLSGHKNNQQEAIIRKVPNGEELAIPSHDLDSNFDRFRNVSEIVNNPLKTLNGFSIQPGSKVVEEAFDDDSVTITILGDKDRITYKVNKKDFVDTKKTSSSNTDEREYVKRNAPGMELNRSYRVKDNFNTLLPTSAPESGPKGKMAPGDTLLDLGPGEGDYAWARKVKIKGDPSGESYYLAEKYFSESDGLEEINSEQTAAGVVTTDEQSVLEEPQPSKYDHSGPTAPPTSGHYTSPEHGNSLSRQFAYSGKPAPSQCQPLADNLRAIRKPDPLSKRKLFQNEVMEAANAYGIHPALLETSITLETNYNSLLENEVEKKAMRKSSKKSGEKLEAHAKARGGSEWGKGLGQFGPALAKKMKLNWYPPPKPSSIPPTKKYLKLYSSSYDNSVWNPRAAIMAKAKHLRQTMDTERFVVDKNGNKIYVNDYLFGRGLAEQARALLSIYNRGDRIVYSLESFYLHNGTFPQSYGQIWGTKPHPKTVARIKQNTRNYEEWKYFLNAQKINRNHVNSGVGLCGAVKEGSILDEYMKNWNQGPNGWEYKK
ncbi:hypothetical protein GW915_10430 [bacterium]|nr:hypothetical protein [bacterium]